MSRLSARKFAVGLTGIAGVVIVVAALAAMTPTVSLAQSAAPASPSASSSLDVPTTKLLAIGSFTAKGTPERWKPLLLSEVRDTVRLYLTGKIDQWYLKQDQSGVVFIMNVTDPKEALALSGPVSLRPSRVDGVPDHPARPDRPPARAFDRSCEVTRDCPHQASKRRYQMSEVSNPRVHARVLPALAAVVGPTTRILAIGSVTAKGTPEAIAPVLPFEVRATVRNHLAGKIEQWFFQTEGYGVVFIMNATSTGEAHDILEKLPLGVAGMMEFELIALGPLAPLAMLIGEPPRS